MAFCLYKTRGPRTCRVNKMAASAELLAEPGLSTANTFYLLLGSAVLLTYTYWRIKRRRIYELADKIPGPKGYPFIGNALDFMGSSLRK